MTQALRFQVLTLPNASWDELLARFRYVEDLGFDLVTTADHFVDWTNPTVPWLESLAAAMHETSRIRLATYVSQIPLRHPAMLAHQALTVDQISGGRLEVWSGHRLTIDPVHDMIGIPNWEPKERVVRFGDYVEVVDHLLSNERSSYEGRYYRIQNAALNLRPIQRPRPPIVVAALSPVSCGTPHATPTTGTPAPPSPAIRRRSAAAISRSTGIRCSRRPDQLLRVREPLRRHGRITELGMFEVGPLLPRRGSPAADVRAHRA
jgi:alkanesulfonate monooxygenase SsuD/methylene tetrahydromethanopterin reductase-like flavin-dependent oxidoreductase (luciferase family)